MKKTQFVIMDSALKLKMMGINVEIVHKKVVCIVGLIETKLRENNIPNNRFSIII